MGRLLEMVSGLLDDSDEITVAPQFPISPRNVLPVVQTNRWYRIKDTHQGVEKLQKTYDFSSAEQKMTFLIELSEYEKTIQHHANTHSTFHEEDGEIIFKVRIEVWTHGIDQVTNLDKEYAAFADTLYRDLEYNVSYE